jgi:colanic acid/amylovoran biosynthesis glycosyltransferase
VTASAADASALHIAYLVNQYPAVSHTFIRREILALERLGLVVHRMAVRGWDGELADEQDKAERTRTRYILKEGLAGLLAAVLRVVATSPLRFLKALVLALRMGHRAFRPMPYHLVYLAQACRLHLWLKATPVRHLHAHFGTNPAELAMLVQALGGPRFSFTVHGPEEFDKPDLHKIGAKAQAAAFVVAISSFCRSQMYRWIPYARWPGIQVVHCGLEKAFHDLPASLPPERPRLVCVGRICEQKGQLLLAQAAAEVIRQGADLELVFAGDGEMRPQLEALVAQLGIERHIRITGWISSQQVRDELLAARALALPSFAEGLPVVIMEAMALGRPVLTTFVAGIPELVIPGECGWLFPAGDVQAMVGCMQACLASSPEQLARMGAVARQRAVARHDIDTEAAKLAALFRDAAAA